ncbi:peptidoglycan recognition protein family protein [Enterococcus sp. AZ192]|uniref:peptidoglycan recognition protein family protein n=1 Tax=unclassified Enterococcus TaxID=2608891 RepID=UPI003D2D9410
MDIKRQIRATPQVGVAPYRQIHPHSTGNPSSTAQNEADYMNRKDLNSGFYTHVVGNGRVIQTAEVGRGAYDVGGGWNYETFAAVELIQSHATRAEFERDYRLYVDLLRQLAKEAGIPLTLDTKDLAGIKTHMYCTYNQPSNGSDHIDPYPYLNQWGITVDQFERDLANGFGTTEINSNTNNNVTTNKPTKGRGETTMQCLYERPINPKTGKLETNGSATAVMFCNGVNCRRLYDGDEIKIIEKVYRDNNGKDIPFYKKNEWNKENPWFVRLEAVFPVTK